MFRVGICLGSGVFGEVYRARMVAGTGLETDVALKVLRESTDPEQQAIARLRDEGRLLARLDHPAILRVVDLVTIEGRVALVTELIEGADFGDCVTGPDPLPLRAQLEVIGTVAAALDAALTTRGDDGRPLGLVHRDVKPQNIRVSRHGQIKLLDFGLARADTVDREAHTSQGQILGSPQFMAPERFQTTEARPAIDIFGLGCCLYQGVSGGQRFYGGLNVNGVVSAGLDAAKYVAWLSQQLRAIPEAPPAVITLLREMLSQKPEGRPTAADVVHRCEDLAREATGDSVARWARRHEWSEPVDHGGALTGRIIFEGPIPEPEVLSASEETTQILNLNGSADEEATEARPPPKLTPRPVALRSSPPVAVEPSALSATLLGVALALALLAFASAVIVVAMVAWLLV